MEFLNEFLNILVFLSHYSLASDIITMFTIIGIVTCVFLITMNIFYIVKAVVKYIPSRKKYTKDFIKLKLNTLGILELTSSNNKGSLIIQNFTDNFYKLGKISYIRVYYRLSPESENFNKRIHHDCSFDFFPIDYVDEAVNTFIKRLESSNPNSCEGGYTIENIHVINNKKLEFKDHGSYIDLVLDKFLKRLRNKDKVIDRTLSYLNRTDIYIKFIINHGEENIHNIPYNRYNILYSLCELINKDPDDKFIDNWVKENYENFSPILESIEKEILLEKYNIS